jgi:putative colanic acid biosynthesis acetyltransferase WcaF
LAEPEISDDEDPPVINLAMAPGRRGAWDRPRWVVYAWAVVEQLLVTNPWQVSSRVRVRALRAFGADIGTDVIFRPRTRVKFPWKLHVGDRSWIGEGVWMHNQDALFIGADVAISQETFLTTGSHAFRTDMALITRPIRIEDGAWIASRCIVLGGAVVGRSAVVAPGTVVRGNVAAGIVIQNSVEQVTGRRFERRGEGGMR